MNIKYEKLQNDFTYEDILERLENMTLVCYHNKHKEKIRVKHHRGLIKLFKTKKDGTSDVLILKKSERIWLKREVLEPFLNIK